MPKNWITPQHQKPPVKFQKKIGGHPLVAQILFDRGFTDAECALRFLNSNQYEPSLPLEFPDLPKAVDRIHTAIKNQEKILIWGDFDVDGQTATTLLFEALEDLGALISYHIPIRITEGHGIHQDMLTRYLTRDPKPDLIITCDTGISDHKAVEYAQSQGVDVIITDHHELPENLPEAYAIINPHSLPEHHPLSTLPGVGVAFKLIEEMYNRRGNNHRLEHFLDLVALGIVADIATLTADTRYLLQCGLHSLRSTRRLGLISLFETTGIKSENINEEHIGFRIGPRLNALGRLSDANPIVEFLTTNDLASARIFSNRLEILNQRRKLLSDQVYKSALAQIDQDSSLLKDGALVLSSPGWPIGIIGIVASRLADRFGVPTILLSIQNDNIARGSARSVEGIHIRNIIARHDDLLISYGGHAGAAGLSLRVEDIIEFSKGLSRSIQEAQAENEISPKITINGYVNLPELTTNLVDEILRLAPFGIGNPPVTLAARDLRLVNFARIGAANEHLKLTVEDKSGNIQDVLWWQCAGETLPDSSAFFDLAFIPGWNIYQGEKKLQSQWVDYHIASQSIINVEKKDPGIKIIDFRHKTGKYELISAICSLNKVEVWAEGEVDLPILYMDRRRLEPAESLAIWTTPPSYWELQNAIEKVNPERVYLFAHNPCLDEPQVFLARLAGLVKHVINQRNGETILTSLAANMAHLDSTVRLGLFWLEAKGIIRIQVDLTAQNDVQQNLKIYRGTGKEKPELADITGELQMMLAETKSFRKYFEKMDVESLKVSIMG